MRQLADGLWYWTARHPEWHPGDFGAQVGCYLAHEGGRTIIIDPLLTEDLDALIDGEVVVAVTIPYHVRDSAEVARALRRRRERAPRRAPAAARRHPVRS